MTGKTVRYGDDGQIMIALKSRLAPVDLLPALILPSPARCEGLMRELLITAKISGSFIAIALRLG
jgi:hypothetical protein